MVHFVYFYYELEQFFLEMILDDIYLFIYCIKKDFEWTYGIIIRCDIFPNRVFEKTNELLLCLIIHIARTFFGGKIFLQFLKGRTVPQKGEKAAKIE